MNDGTSYTLHILGQVDVNIVVADIFLARICCINVGFGACNKIAPRDASDVREFSPPNR